MTLKPITLLLFISFGFISCLSFVPHFNQQHVKQLTSTHHSSSIIFHSDPWTIPKYSPGHPSHLSPTQHHQNQTHQNESDPLHPNAQLPQPDYGPHHYNKLLNSTTRIQFLPSIVFLFLFALVSMFMFIGSAYQQRRFRLITAHPEAREYRSRLADAYENEYANNLGVARSAEQLDLSNRAEEKAVKNYVHEVKGTGSSVRNQQSDQDYEPLLRPLHTPGQENNNLRSIAAPNVEVVDSSNLMYNNSTTPTRDSLIILLANEPDTEWGPMSYTSYEYRQFLTQPDFMTKLKNCSQVLVMLYMLSFALALMGTQMLTSLPQPTIHDDVVGSRMRTLVVILSQFSIFGIGLMWAFAEGSLVAVQDLNRSRIFALLTVLVFLIAYGVSLEAENRARLNELNRVFHPNMVH